MFQCTLTVWARFDTVWEFECDGNYEYSWISHDSFYTQNITTGEILPDPAA
ncbi:Protein of unknown function [Pyronema omphalodes CBS 100304]|uniref:Uncharacterized protein n=1 Tax=Pyronema omphalodes (strain CBS 100304) TaxID=1076935 RepID=U4LU25_PYROM|nr:Protein of unknown function [Pyronema omphalodes CBS 100304]